MLQWKLGVKRKIVITDDVKTTRTTLVPLIGDIWSPIVGTQALIEGRRRV